MQFHLSTLFFAMLVVATSMALMGGWGFPGGLYALVVATFLALWIGGNGRAGEKFVALLVVPVIAALFPLLREPADAARRFHCRNNLTQLAISTVSAV